MEATFADAVVDALELQAAQSAINGLTMEKFGSFYINFQGGAFLEMRYRSFAKGTFFHSRGESLQPPSSFKDL